MVELEGGIRRQTFAAAAGHRPRPLLPAALLRRRLDGGRHRARAARRGDALGGDAGRAGRAGASGSLITHFHPDHVGAAADLAELTGAPVFQGAGDYDQCVRTWGELRVAGADARLPARPRHARRRMSSRSQEEGRRVRAVRALRARPRAPRPRGRARRLGGAAPARPRRRPPRAPARRDPGRRRHPARIDHPERRPLSGLPARSARRLPRVAGAHRRARPADRAAGPRRADRGSRREGARADRAPRERLDRTATRSTAAA